ncbi:MAG: hypothetical protein HYX53_16345 [Chloroflexi bacterium]|nr:hypothetical protein [Chloroflexota bacterium]
MGINDHSIWPAADLADWPPDIPTVDRLAAILTFLRRLKFELCDHFEFEEGYEKVAILLDEHGPTHVALQLGDGSWTSKLGDWEDINHTTLDVLEGSRYGTASLALRRVRSV